jgi:hypothetical protein
MYMRSELAHGHGVLALKSGQNDSACGDAVKSRRSALEINPAGKSDFFI